MDTKLYQLMRWVLGLALGFYFRRIERFHAERVPTSARLLTANHPNSSPIRSSSGCSCRAR